MTKKNQDFETYAGDTFIISASISGSDGGAYDLTAVSSMKWMLMEAPGAASLLSKGYQNGTGITISASIATITGTAGDTSSLAGIYYHELQIVDSVGRVSTAMVGNAIINKRGI